MYKPIKTLGQNFLVDRSVARDMVGAFDVGDGNEIIEIGPGHGVITDILVEKFRDSKSELYAVEIDERFFEKISGMYSLEKNVHVVCDDVLFWLPKFSPKGEFGVIGSLPYYITSPILHQIIKMEKMPRVCVLLIQKEVAEKIKSRAPDSSYMSCFVQTFFDVSYIGKVPKNRFKPEPKVDGGIIKLTRRDKSFSREFKARYEGFLHKAFSNPRKMLNKVFTLEELSKGSIDPSLRPQNLDWNQWLNFYKVLNDNEI